MEDYRNLFPQEYAYQFSDVEIRYELAERNQTSHDTEREDYGWHECQQIGIGVQNYLADNLAEVMRRARELGYC
jgi:hypothetical protein